MSKYSALIKRASNATAATALALASLTPAIMLGGSAKAVQIENRSITMSTSKDGTASSWTVNLGGTWDADNIDLWVCNSPIIGSNCYDPAGTATQTLVNSAQITGKVEGVSFNTTNPAVNGGPGTFYVRIHDTDTDDWGAVALSTTNDVTINARVQETLTFCVGTNANVAANVTSCAGLSGSTIDLGILASNDESTTPVSSTTDGNGKEGGFLLSTNAYNGAVVTYTSAHGLAVGETTCENANTNVTDQCINSLSAGFDFASNTEKFGMSITNVNDYEQVAGESHLKGTSPYNNYVDDYNLSASGLYAWNTTAATEIASTTSVVATDIATLQFKGQSAITTPSGFYSTSANFVATATF